MNKIKFGKNVFSFLLSANIFFVFPQFFLTQPTFADSLNKEVKLTIAQYFFRTELYFGMNKKDGSTVSDEEWNKFLSDEVTPRFPKGFTSLQATGQYQILGGLIVKENSRVLIFLYPLNKRKISNQRIEQIRSLYKRKFLQESILRLDFQQSVKVSF